MAPEVASAYYRYGCALLYQAQESADVFGGPIRGAAATDGDKENDGEAKPPPPRPEPIAHDDKGKRPAVEPIAEETADDAEDAEGEEGQRELDVEGDLQLAWENLEAARTIWSYSPDKHMNELADVHSQLADVNMENEAFEDALADIESAMDFHKKAGVGDDDRKVADLQFRKCMVSSFNNTVMDAISRTSNIQIQSLQNNLQALQFIGRNKEALESVKDAMATLDRCKTKTTAEANGDDVPEEKKQAAIKTVKDLATVLDELKDKVEELNGVIEEEEATRGMVRGMVAQLAAAQQAQQGEGSALGPAATNNSDAQKVGASPVSITLFYLLGRSSIIFSFIIGNKLKEVYQLSCRLRIWA